MSICSNIIKHGVRIESFSYEFRGGSQWVLAATPTTHAIFVGSGENFEIIFYLLALLVS